MTVLERLRHVVKAQMKASGIKQGYIAQNCDYDPTFFSNILNGYRALRPEDIDKICRGLDITPDQAFGWDPIPGLEDNPPSDRFGAFPEAVR